MFGLGRFGPIRADSGRFGPIRAQLGSKTKNFKI